MVFNAATQSYDQISKIIVDASGCGTR